MSDCQAFPSANMPLSALHCDAALADLLPKLKPADLPALPIEILANNEVVMKQMERRGPPRKKRLKRLGETFVSFKLSRYLNFVVFQKRASTSVRVRETK
jgi:hypothetical protein